MGWNVGHELEKLDIYLDTPIGSSYDTLIRHHNPALLNEKLVEYGITLDEFGMVARGERGLWRDLMVRVGISKRYWKDVDLLIDDQVIGEL